MNTYFHKDNIKHFIQEKPNLILGEITSNSSFNVDVTQRDAWKEEINLLQKTLKDYTGEIYFEYTIPRLGKRIDTVLIIDGCVFVLEFKVDRNGSSFTLENEDQVWDYALDLKNFHKESHNAPIIPILISPFSSTCQYTVFEIYKDEISNDGIYKPICCNSDGLVKIIRDALQVVSKDDLLDPNKWGDSSYSPTPTIIEAATYMFKNHSVKNITSTAASAENIEQTCSIISDIIEDAQSNKKKAICFITGVPGAGKTLVGLRIAIEKTDKDKSIPAVYLSGNGPLVNVLREALVRDKVNRSYEEHTRNKTIKKLTKTKASIEVKLFIQNVHNFRDDCLKDTEFSNGVIVKEGKAPVEHIAIFDEAQRAWTQKETATFMQKKKHTPGFPYSESYFLISCLDRHKDWAVVICLVGGGQEINRGEAGISEWLKALNQEKFQNWDIYISPNLSDSEYAATESIKTVVNPDRIHLHDELHLSVSMRSFRAENLSLFIKNLLDLDINSASEIYKHLNKYPIVLTRSIEKGKEWVKTHARGSERYGVMVSSQAFRLRPYALDVQVKTDPVHWFLDDKDDVRSSYFMEDVATEFDVQGLELDWSCVVWDGDMRFVQGSANHKSSWAHYQFKGSQWKHINIKEGKLYQKNAYRVLLTRARQGMCIVVPEGNCKKNKEGFSEDKTRLPEFYDTTYNYLKSIGIKEI